MLIFCWPDGCVVTCLGWTRPGLLQHSYYVFCYEACHYGIIGASYINSIAALIVCYSIYHTGTHKAAHYWNTSGGGASARTSAPKDEGEHSGFKDVPPELDTEDNDDAKEPDQEAYCAADRETTPSAEGCMKLRGGTCASIPSPCWRPSVSGPLSSVCARVQDKDLGKVRHWVTLTPRSDLPMASRR